MTKYIGLSVTETAELLAVSRQTLYKWIDKGELELLPIKGCPVVSAESIRSYCKWVESREFVRRNVEEVLG